ncbi:membrane lipoprotein [Vibrio phage 199E37-1]|nr:membrane lipoprotein [Vibrio phage 199E37-1]
MANIKRTVSDSNGNYLYTVIQTHCSHSSAAGSFQVAKGGALISSKLIGNNSTTVVADDVYKFEEV